MMFTLEQSIALELASHWLSVASRGNCHAFTWELSRVLSSCSGPDYSSRDLLVCGESLRLVSSCT